MMRVDVDGSGIETFDELVSAIVDAFGADAMGGIAREVVGRPYFGRGLHSFQDCLFGGCMGEPPYDFVIRSADRMVASFGYSGVVAYCDRMLDPMARGNRGLDSVESIEQRRYFEEARAAALREEGDTLLDWILAVFEGAPARITIIGDSGDVLRVAGHYPAVG